MNRKISFIFSLLITCFAITVNAQKFKVTEGNTDVLKGVKEINLAFDYSNMGVGKYEAEADYIQHKKEDYNKKESGRGNTWERAWIADREKRFQPQFAELFNKHGEGMQVGKFPSAQYTMTIHTTFVEPGYNIGISRKNAEIDGEIVITETNNPGKIVLRISFNGAKGRSFGGGDYDTGFRIQEAYAMLGKSLAKYLN